jgi:HEAT repeat protein
MSMSNTTRERFRSGSLLLWALALAAPLSVHADTPQTFVVYDRVRGELSPGTDAPKLESMMNSIRSASPTALTAVLEYGSRVECMECIPLLSAKLLDSADPKVREMSAWWLRQRPFGYGRVAVAMRKVAVEDQDAMRRGRAVEALGEFLDVGGLPALERAAMEDSSSDVRLAAVRALGRLNAPQGHAVLAAAFEDGDVDVRRAALDQVVKLNHWDNAEAVTARLDDDDVKVRVRAAQITGELRLPGADDALAQILARDKAPAARQAAAWALGRLGGSVAKDALIDARTHEADPGVIDAIDIAIRMR